MSDRVNCNPNKECREVAQIILWAYNSKFREAHVKKAEVLLSA
jgi:hypothetical protein